MLGSVNDVLIGKTGEPLAIIKANGKLHPVPWSRLRFGNAKQNSDNKVILPGETENALKASPQFHYRNKGNS
jgi:hypothetical protein